MDNKGQIIFPGVVMDNKDPLMLGRLRVSVDKDNHSNIIRTLWEDNTLPKDRSTMDPNDIPSEYMWTAKDPFLTQPFLPFFLNLQPEISERVNVIYADKNYPFQNRFYIHSDFSSPMLSSFESYLSAGKHTSSGNNIKGTPDIKKRGTNDYYNELSKGVYPEPSDNSLIGRGTADVVVKKDDVLIRAGRNVEGKSDHLPKYNNERAFVQLSKYSSSQETGKKKEVKKVTIEERQPNFLLEWTIINPENLMDNFTGVISLYQLKAGIESLKSGNFSVRTNLSPSDLTLIGVQNFNSKSKEETAMLINDVLVELNDRGIYTTDQGVQIKIPDVFPLAFRPDIITYKWVSEMDPVVYHTEFNNISYFLNNVKLRKTDKVSGSGVLYSRNNYDKKVSIQKEEYDEKNVIPENRTVGIMGADDLMFISHRSTIPEKGKIDLKGTVYGIESTTFNNEILPKTSSFVRGEELMEFLNLVIMFLATHVHPFPGMPPVPTGQTGIQLEEILKELRNASNKILNKHIRVN